MNYPICYIWIQLLIPYKSLWSLFKASSKINNLGLYVHKLRVFCLCRVTQISLPEVWSYHGHPAPVIIICLVPLSILSDDPPTLFLFHWEENMKGLLSRGSSWRHCSELLLLHLAQVLGLSSWAISCILVAFPPPNIFWCYFPLDRLKNDSEEPVLEPLFKGTTQAFFSLHYNQSQSNKKKNKSRIDDSIHPWSRASEVECRWHHGCCELVPAVFLDHFGLWNKM